MHHALTIDWPLIPKWREVFCPSPIASHTLRIRVTLVYLCPSYYIIFIFYSYLYYNSKLPAAGCFFCRSFKNLRTTYKSAGGYISHLTFIYLISRIWINIQYGHKIADIRMCFTERNKLFMLIRIQLKISKWIWIKRGCWKILKRIQIQVSPKLADFLDTDTGHLVAHGHGPTHGHHRRVQFIIPSNIYIKL